MPNTETEEQTLIEPSQGGKACARCSDTTLPLNIFRVCRKCFLGWNDNSGVHCALCQWQSRLETKEIMEFNLETHLSKAHGAVMQFNHKIGGEKTSL